MEQNDSTLCCLCALLRSLFKVFADKLTGTLPSLYQYLHSTVLVDKSFVQNLDYSSMYRHACGSGPNVILCATSAGAMAVLKGHAANRVSLHLCSPICLLLVCRFLVPSNLTQIAARKH